MESLGDGAECLHAREPGCVPWLRALVSPPSAAPWADVFAEVHPDAEERFTTWGQASNSRYSNTGTRIDYVICDRATFRDCVVCSPTSDLAGAAPADSAASAASALNAATCFGRWHGAATRGVAQGDGLCLQSDNMRLNDTQFPSRPHTGLVYTPPSYSDHIAVSAFFTATLMEPLAAMVATAPQADTCPNVSSETTKRCQPWVRQPSIAAFFGSSSRAATPSPVAAASVAAVVQPTPAPPAPSPTPMAPEAAPAPQAPRPPPKAKPKGKAPSAKRRKR
mmetsp:Transcript_22879/g.63959  ORF Transcript_22879/g.63959 Transcript_22879/m.63959 type:complete len:279 (+) Transcript_22879:1-837(+)